jgi:hypothetical protein
MTASPLHRMSARGITVAFDPEHGQLALFEVARGTRRTAPFARVPWADRGDPARLPPGAPPHLARMSGDFFCAPFSTDDIEGAPLHGWTANARWDHVATTALPDGTESRFRLCRPVAGARVEKVWRLRDDHPFLYQRHEFHGGTRPVPVAHHAMIDLRTGGHLAFSPKLFAETPPDPAEPGRSLLAYPATASDLRAFPGRDGPVDLCRWPIGRRHEEFVMLVDDPAQTHGWVTALRPAQGDVAMLLKRVAVLPQTMLWMSNGGRDRLPWGGEHMGVLGIEEACALGGEGWSAALAPNRLTRQGIPTALDLPARPVVAVATAMGALPCAATGPVGLALSDGGVRLSDGTTAPFDAGWLACDEAGVR